MAGTPRPVSHGCVVRLTSRANNAAFHGKKRERTNQEILRLRSAALRCTRRRRGSGKRESPPRPLPSIRSLIHSSPPRRHPATATKPNQPSRSARFHRLLSSSPRLRNCSNRDSEGETRRSRRRSLSSSSCLFPLLMEGQRRPRFFKVLVGDFARRIVSSPLSSCCCRDPLRSPLSLCLRSRRPW